MNDEHRLVSSAKRRWWIVASSVLGVTSAIGVIADLAQLDSWLTTGGGAVIRVIAYLVILFAIGVLINEKGRRSSRTITSWIAIVLSVLFISALWPTADGTQRQEQRMPGIIVTTPSSPPIRTLTAWSADINGVCRNYLVQAGLSLDQLRGTGDRLNELSTRYDTSDPAQADKYVEELTDQIKEILPAMSSLDVAYSVINDSAASIEPPQDTNSDTARAWLKRYRERADRFLGVYEPLSKFAEESNRFLRAGYLLTASINSQRYGSLTPEVLDQGRGLGVVSCP